MAKQAAAENAAKRLKEFGVWLTQHRDESGYTQQIAADRANIARVTYARIEAGKKTKSETVSAIAEALGLDEDDCLERAGFRPSERRKPPDIQLGLRLDRIINRLPPIQRQKVEQQLEKDAEQYVSLLTA